MTATYWCAGERVSPSAAEWSRTTAAFLGSGFRVRFPAAGPAVAHARRQVDAVAALLRTSVDPAPWDALPPAPAYEMTGGWEYRLDRTWGPAWTALRPVSLPPVLSTSAAAVNLPWAWSSGAPTAGLPMISALESDLALAHLGSAVGLWAVGPWAVGLWWDHRDLLCSTTAGPPLVHAADGAWLTPDASSGAVRSWAYDEAARHRAARPTALTREVVARARTVLAVSDLGVETRLVVETPETVLDPPV